MFDMRRKYNAVSKSVLTLFNPFNIGDESNTSNLGMSDTSSNASMPMPTSAAPVLVDKQIEPERPNQSHTEIEEDTPPLLPRSVSNQTGPNRPLPASPTHQIQSQR